MQWNSAKNYGLTKRDTARVLNISLATLNRWMAKGCAPPYRKIGPRLIRFNERELLEWAHRQPGPARLN
jgi:excisionase family DNA binding protein